VNHRIVDSYLSALIKRIITVISYAVGKSHAKSQVTTSILVKQGVKKCQFRVSYGRIVRNKCNLTKICGTFIHRDHLFEEFLILFRMYFNSLALMESNAEVLNELTSVRKRACCHNCTFSKASHRCGKTLLRGDIGIKFYT
jgi:hypothetical protein